MDWFELALLSIAAVGFFTYVLIHPKRSDIKAISGAALATLGTLCMIASLFFTHETVVSGFVIGAIVLFIASIAFSIAAGRDRSKIQP